MTKPSHETKLIKRVLEGISRQNQNATPSATGPPPGRQNSPPRRERERNLAAAEESSVLDTIGAEITGLMAPVTICMLLVVVIVSDLPQPSIAAKLVYVENPSDSAAVKLRGAILNAIVFVVLIAAFTFFMVILYYYNCVSASLFKRQNRLSTFALLGGMGGAIFLSLIQYFSVPIDVITFSVLLFNFTVVGVLSLCSDGMPIILRQGYVVVLGVIVAAWFTRLPEWTTWALLVALAVYDLVAVLSPRGPIKLLVELVQSRDEELPGLVYEARQTASESTSPRGQSLELLLGGVLNNGVVEMQRAPRGNLYDISRIFENFYPEMMLENFDATQFNDVIERSRLAASSPESPPSSNAQLEYSTVVGNPQSEIVVDKMQNLGNESQRVRMENIEASDPGEGIKLGLGDFIFYSVLVGRAVMYDMMTVYACYLAIISGLGCTLLLLSVSHRALPGLPISIGLGVIFYFLTRLLLEPFIIATSTSLVFF